MHVKVNGYLLGMLKAKFKSEHINKIIDIFLYV